VSSLIEFDSSLPSSNNTLSLQLGSVCCALKFEDAEVYSRLKQYYQGFLTEQPADITIELEGTDRLSPDALDVALSDIIYIHEGGNRFRTSSQIITGQYDLKRGMISLTGERSLVNPDMEFNHLNQLLSIAYYSACKVKYNGNPPPAFLVHACGILRHGETLVFSGSSGTGKTTIARLCSDRHGEVLNDEMLLISRRNLDGNRIVAQSAPAISKLAPRRNIAAPVRCILLLKRGDKTTVRYLDRVDAYLQFIRQIITPAYIGQRDRRAVYSLMADFSDEVTQAVPVYTLEFNLDEKSLWQIIDELEETLEREE
jgi:hypothetical protein